ncbi:MAG: hypothetical protein HQL52_08320, partial [Magnetococcales bacterium]|nr:hypothetical protein [Magnetococcales bacterium]
NIFFGQPDDQIPDFLGQSRAADIFENFTLLAPIKPAAVGCVFHDLHEIDNVMVTDGPEPDQFGFLFSGGDNSLGWHPVHEDFDLCLQQSDLSVMPWGEVVGENGEQEGEHAIHGKNLPCLIKSETIGFL